MKLKREPTSVTITLSPKDYWLRKKDDESYMLTHRIDMSYAGKSDQEGDEFMFISQEQAQVFKEAGFAEIL